MNQNIEEILTPSMEDCLEVIYYFVNQNGFARVGEIAKRLEVKSPTVNASVKLLLGYQLVEHEKYGYVKLTKKGKEIASNVQGKHDILFKFLTDFLMIDKSLAGEEACSIEHAISNETFERLVKFFTFIKECNNTKPKLLENFDMYLKTGKKIKCACQK
ncbi:MAG: metal-dependent transcriptional regulator [Bacteroidetes bacterium]|nr:metal-dependent transcriptional regulator [Bacteroidota bacterium]